MMKKRWIALLMSAVCALSLAACSSGTNDAADDGGSSADDQIVEDNAGAADDTAGDDATDDDLTAGLGDVLLLMAEANTAESLMANSAVVAYRTSNYYADGSVNSQYSYQDAERYVWEEDGSVEIDENGTFYGYDKETGSVYRTLFLLDSYEVYREYWCLLSRFIYFENEVVESTVEADGVLTVQTSVLADEGVADEWQNYGHALAVGDTVLYTYEVDAETYELLTLRMVWRAADGSETLLQEAERVTDPEIYVPSEELTAQVFADDTRTVTFVVDPGEENEQTYSAEIAVGCGVRYFADAVLELYTDEACTVAYVTGSDDLTSDLTFYALRVAE